MRALYRLGDAPAALTVYADAREALFEHLGLEPGSDLQDLQRAILNREVAPDPVESRAVIMAAAPSRHVPAQLPLDVRGFTGRLNELAQLDAVLAAAAKQQTAVVISAIAGMAGVGKTAVAVHWAHQVRKEFPDGQLYVNLHGFDPTSSPVSSPPTGLSRSRWIS